MKLRRTKFFERKLKKYLSKHLFVEKKLRLQLKKLTNNPNYPSLRLHKLKGKRAVQYSIWIEKDLRVIFVFSQGEIILTDLVSHDQY